MKNLTAQERKELISLEKKIPHKGVSTRIKIVLALDLGYTAKEVAKLFLLDDDTVGKWKNLYEKSHYLSDWLGDENNGYQGKLTKDQEKMLEKRERPAARVNALFPAPQARCRRTRTAAACPGPSRQPPS